ncbi:uncharacterized protein LOC126092371 isoform X1 [Schistocerca cancellata]|uniref:uncharacterized protein LOC126092371 isoform X1 n=1 Tax=Schistocerca cancellata TaxID=274614 RepID=UPI002118FF51|nr:uncharacterized protein LOC126092371 isoform X1 [Schistocerca cancellata]
MKVLTLLVAIAVLVASARGQMFVENGSKWITNPYPEMRDAQLLQEVRRGGVQPHVDPAGLALRPRLRPQLQHPARRRASGVLRVPRLRLPVLPLDSPAASSGFLSSYRTLIPQH